VRLEPGIGDLVDIGQRIVRILVPLHEDSRFHAVGAFVLGQLLLEFRDGIASDGWFGHK
jgi:hypothetical protein